MRNKKEIVLINPPHFDPTGPSLALALLKSYILQCSFNNEIKVDIYDFGIESFYWFIKKDTMKYALNVIENEIYILNKNEHLNYQEQCRYFKLLESKLILNNFSSEVEYAVKIEKNASDFNNAEKRNWAHFVINKVIEAVGNMQTNNFISAQDYRISKSPFSTEDIRYCIENESDNIYYPFIKERLEKICWERTEIIGISISYAKQMIPAMIIANKIKKKYPNVWVVVGGSLLAHLNAEGVKRLLKWCDAIVQGEGEIPLELVVKARLEGIPLSGDMGVFCKDERGNACLPSALKGADLNSIPTPDFSDFPFDMYLVPHKVIPLQIRRDCYWGRCTFCCLYKAFKHKKMNCSAEKVMDMIQEMYKKYSVNCFEFVDDAIEPDFAQSFSKNIIQSGLEINWFAYARLDERFTPEVFKIMKEAGCVGLKFGLESASEGIIQKMKKGIDIKHASVIIKNARSAGIIPQVAFFTGFPGEKKADLDKTISFIKDYVIHYGIIAYNGAFRLMKSMPLFNSLNEYRIKKVVKWNSSEDLIDYYVLQPKNTARICLNVDEYIKENLIKLVYEDLPREVTLRRYWFGNLCNVVFEGHNNIKFDDKCVWEVSANFDVSALEIFRDANRGDFSPGKGAYSKRSYIAKNLHDDIILKQMNLISNILNKEEKIILKYNPLTFEFARTDQ